MQKIYKHSHFKADAFGHGGHKRTAQISSLLADSGIAFQEALLENKALYRDKLSLYLRGLNYTQTIRNGHTSKYAIGRYLRLFEQFAEEAKPDLLLWESTVGYNVLLAEVLYKKNIPVIGLPHNIESLVSGSRSVFSNKISPDWLPEELKYLRYCDQVFTISAEEQWLLANAGIHAAFLPYYPAPETVQYLLNIRERRQNGYTGTKKQKKLLLLGTFYNKPTAGGYIELLSQIRAFKDIEIHVAGFGSEQLSAIFTGANINIWGTVSNEKLADLITLADYGLIHQQASSGSLTRIPELLLAGLPLLLNSHAARSCYDKMGVQIYRSFEELEDLLHSQTACIPPAAGRPAEEGLFIDYIRQKISLQA